MVGIILQIDELNRRMTMREVVEPAYTSIFKEPSFYTRTISGEAVSFHSLGIHPFVDPALRSTLCFTDNHSCLLHQITPMQVSLLFYRASLSTLPPELLCKICLYLQGHAKANKGSDSLLSLASTCKRLYHLALPLLWDTLDITFDQPGRHDLRLLQDLKRLLSRPEHPVFRNTHTARIVIPYYTAELLDNFCRDLDGTLAAILLGVTKLKQVRLDLSMVNDPLHRFPRTLETLLRRKRALETIELLGLAMAQQLPAIRFPHVTNLRVEMVGNALPFDFSHFSHLRHLHLGLDCREEELADSSTLQFPSTIWKTIECFVLQLYGCDVHATIVTEAMMTSILVSQLRHCVLALPSYIDRLFTGQQKAECPSLRDLGVFWNVEQADPNMFLETMLKKCTGMKRLALAIPKIPQAQTIRDLAAKAPGLTELTLCAHLSAGTWRWSDSAKEYAQALAAFEHLQKLAINHDDLAVLLNAYGEEEPCGNFTGKCTDAGEVLRRAFVQELAEACPKLESVGICPLDQENSRLEIHRENASVVAVDYVEHSSQFFWERS